MPAAQDLIFPHPSPTPLFLSALSTCAPPPACRGWFDGAVHSLDGYLRPGCVHLTAQAMLGGYAEERLGRHETPPAEAAPGGVRAEQQEEHKSCCHRPTPAGGDPTAARSGAPGQAQVLRSAPFAESPAAEPAPVPPAAAVAAPNPAGACCGRKRAAESPAEPAGAVGVASAVRRVVDRMLRSGELQPALTTHAECGAPFPSPGWSPCCSMRGCARRLTRLPGPWLQARRCGAPGPCWCRRGLM